MIYIFSKNSTDLKQIANNKMASASKRIVIIIIIEYWIIRISDNLFASLNSRSIDLFDVFRLQGFSEKI